MGENRINAQGVAGLKKYDIKISGIVFMLYCLVAAGAFGIEEMIPATGPGMTLLLLCAFPIVWSYPVSCLVAECSSVMPSEGGIYVWVKEAFGEFWGFQTGWWSVISIYITNGVYVTLVCGYVNQMLPMTALGDQVLKIGMILIFTIVNLMGLQEVDKVSTILSIMIMAAFLLVAVVGFCNWETNPFQPFVPEGESVTTGLGDGVCIAVWMYCGYECISSLAGEVKNPQVIPKGVIIAMPFVALSYILPTIGGLCSLPEGSWKLWSTGGGFSQDNIGYATVLTEHLGAVWGYIFLIFAVISQCAMFNAYMASGSRGFFVLADDHLFPPSLVKVNKSKGVPYVGVLSLSIVTYVLSQSDFTTLVSMEVVFDLALYIILPIALLKLRKMMPIEKRKEKNLYVIKGGKWALLFYCGAPVVIAVFALLINGTDYLTTGLIALCSGPVAYILFKRHYKGMNAVEPEKYPLSKFGLAKGDTVRIGAFSLMTGIMAFFGQFWLRIYEKNWVPEDYDVFADMIPQVRNWLAAGGLIFMAAGFITILIGMKKDRPDELSQADLETTMNKYLNG